MIITDEKLLRLECQEVQPEEISDLVRKLEEELQKSAALSRPGIGLAAPQIGIAKKIAIVRVPNPLGEINSLNLINAEILHQYDLRMVSSEGCLSFPDKYVKTQRYHEIVVQSQLDGKNFKKFVATGLTAICIQHELDHLKGKDAKLLIDW